MICEFTKFYGYTNQVPLRQLTYMQFIESVQFTPHADTLNSICNMIHY